MNKPRKKSVNLVEKALAVEAKSRGRGVDPTRGEIDLIMAYINGRVTYTQMATAAGVSPTNTTNWAGAKIIRAVRSGLLTLARAGR